MKNLASSCKNRRESGNGRPSCNRRDARRCTRPQEAERQTPPHPPGVHVWPAVLLPRSTSGQEKQVIARLTASGHASNSGERAIANDRAAPPDGQGNAHAHGGSGSGQKTATTHAESGHGVTDTDPRIETGHDATESFHAESGSGQKTATAHSVSDHEKSVTRTMTASHAHDRLTANGKRSENESDGNVHESHPHVTKPSYPSSIHAPKSVTRGRIKRGSKRLKTPPNSHVVERAVRIGESQQTWRSGKRASAEREPPPLLHLPKEEEKKERARLRQTNAQRHSRPSRRTKIEREGRKHP